MDGRGSGDRSGVSPDTRISERFQNKGPSGGAQLCRSSLGSAAHSLSPRSACRSSSVARIKMPGRATRGREPVRGGSVRVPVQERGPEVWAQAVPAAPARAPRRERARGSAPARAAALAREAGVRAPARAAAPAPARAAAPALAVERAQERAAAPALAVERAPARLPEAEVEPVAGHPGRVASEIRVREGAPSDRSGPTEPYGFGGFCCLRFSAPVDREGGPAGAGPQRGTPVTEAQVSTRRGRAPDAQWRTPRRGGSATPAGRVRIRWPTKGCRGGRGTDRPPRPTGLNASGGPKRDRTGTPPNRTLSALSDGWATDGLAGARDVLDQASKVTRPVEQECDAPPRLIQGDALGVRVPRACDDKSTGIRTPVARRFRGHSSSIPSLDAEKIPGCFSSGVVRSKM